MPPHLFQGWALAFNFGNAPAQAGEQGIPPTCG
jgi:hypothetical protein